MHKEFMSYIPKSPIYTIAITKQSISNQMHILTRKNLGSFSISANCVYHRVASDKSPFVANLKILRLLLLKRNTH